jgi:hypothetical protein
MLWIAASALLLSACASTNTRDGMVYRDGSWYAPAADGHGDYYTGASHDHDHYYDVPWAWSVGFVPYGGYCPVMYRYCTSFWADSFYGAGYYPWGYQPWVYHPLPRHRRHHEDEPVAGQTRRPRPPVFRDPAATERSSPSPPPSGGIGLGSGRANGGEGAPRRRARGGRSGAD